MALAQGYFGGAELLDDDYPGEEAFAAYVPAAGTTALNREAAKATLADATFFNDFAAVMDESDMTAKAK